MELKEGLVGLVFNENKRLEFLKNFQALFLKPKLQLENLQTERSPASLHVFYDLKLYGELEGQLKLTFSSENELKQIKFTKP